MTRLLYSVFMWLAQPLVRRKLARRGVQEPAYLEAVAERFGHYTTPPLPPGGLTVWLHAVSLGETRAAAVLVAGLRERLPGMRLLLTHGTATGRAEGAMLLQPGDVQTWQPWDTPGAVRRFLRHFKPHIGILMETELWPNLAAGCQHAGVPLVLANARLSEKSLQRARRLAWLARPAYRRLMAVWAQTPDDAARLTTLGAPVQGVFGNLKFDARPNLEQVAAGRLARRRAGRPVILLASSREGEEQALLEILASFSPLALVNKGGNAIDSIVGGVQWLIVPRHPQRFDEVAALIEAHGFAVSRRSGWQAGPPVEALAVIPADVDVSFAPPDNPQAVGVDTPRPTIWLGDSLGEMAFYYGLADVALLGGSFEPLGGQNLIEAAACACPVVMGPHTFNFAQAAQLAQAAGAAQRVEHLGAGVQAALALARNPPLLLAARQASDAFANAHRGATQRLVGAIAQLLGR